MIEPAFPAPEDDLERMPRYMLPPVLLGLLLIDVAATILTLLA